MNPKFFLFKCVLTVILVSGSSSIQDKPSESASEPSHPFWGFINHQVPNAHWNTLATSKDIILTQKTRGKKKPCRSCASHRNALVIQEPWLPLPFTGPGLKSHPHPPVEDLGIKISICLSNSPEWLLMTFLHSSVTTHILFLLVKKSACNAGDSGSIRGLGRSPGEGNGHPLQYSCMAGYSPWGHKSRTRPERPTLLWKRAQCYLFKYFSLLPAFPLFPFFSYLAHVFPDFYHKGSVRVLWTLNSNLRPWHAGWASYLQILLSD